MTKRYQGLGEAILGTMLWGASGTVAQFVFSRYPISSLWLVGLRLLLAGVLLLGWFGFSHGRAVFAIWRQPKMVGLLLAFSFLGMLPSQLTYFLAIQYGNAPTATVLQFLGPLFIIVFLAVVNHRWPRRVDLVSIALALFGTYLLVTNGHFTSLTLAPLALLWGVLAGVSQASYTLIPKRLLAAFDARLVVGWAMFLGSFPFIPILVTTPLPHLSLGLVTGILFIVIAGTMFAYLLYLKSLDSLLPSTTGMLSAFEPLTATVLAITLLGTPITGAEMLGGLCIILTTGLQALPQRVTSET